MEVLKTIKGFNGRYKVSNHGFVYSYYRGRKKKLTLHKGKGGLTADLWLNYKRKAFSVASLVAVYFMGYIQSRKTHVKHKDKDFNNNHVNNLMLLTNRDSIGLANLEQKSSKYVGVAYHKKDKLYNAKIRVNKRHLALGSYKNELDAHNAYQRALSRIELGDTTLTAQNK